MYFTSPMSCICENNLTEMSETVLLHVVVISVVAGLK